MFFHFQETGTINRGTATSCRDGTGHSLSRWCGWFLPGWVSAISYFAVIFKQEQVKFWELTFYIKNSYFTFFTW